MESGQKSERGFVSKDGKKTYGDEQEELKKAFLEAVEREGCDGGGEREVVVYNGEEGVNQIYHFGREEGKEKKVKQYNGKEEK